MAHRRTLRGLIWASLTLRLAGLVFDAFWHAEHSDFDAVTGNEMIEHLRTVHLPIYIGVFFVVMTTALALLRQIERSERGAGLPIAVAFRATHWKPIALSSTTRATTRSCSM